MIHGMTVLLLVVSLFVGLNSALEIITNPIVFGETVKLYCNIPDCQPCNDKQPCQWTGGINYSLLTMDGESKYPAKYNMLVNESFPSSYLEIYNFSEADVGIEYTCTCGFLDKTSVLTVNPNDVLMLPSTEFTDDSSVIVDDVLLINFTLQKVNPVPNCSLHFRDEVIDTKINFTIQSTGFFYKAEFEEYFQIKDSFCEGELEILCVSSSISVTVVNKYLGHCEGLFWTKRLYLIISLVLVALTVMFSFVLYINKRNDESRCLKCCRKYDYTVATKDDTSQALGIKNETDSNRNKSTVVDRNLLDTNNV